MVRAAVYNAAMSSMWLAWRKFRASSPLVLDSAIAGSLALLVLVEGGAQYPVASLLSTVPLAWRRQQPLLVFSLVLLGAMWAAGPAPYIALGSGMLATYSVGAYSRYRTESLLVVLATATFILKNFGGSLPPVPDFAGPYLILVPMWLVGNAIRNWQLRVSALQDHAVLQAQEQERATQMALADERARIARELHDVVAHSVSVMVVQAGAARQVLASAPAQAHEALLSVEATGREAMTELRTLLGVLNLETSDISLAPQPGMDQLDSLVERVGDAGLPVEVHILGTPRPLPAGIDLTAYRIVQEALTNALKYSGLALTEVLLDYRESELKLEVLDQGSGLSRNQEAGRGLVGMRERVALYGGRLETGPRLERGYAVRAWIPL